MVVAKLTDSKCNAARHIAVPPLARAPDARDSDDGEDRAEPDGPFLGHGRQALAGDEPGCEDPYVASGNLEKITWDRVDAAYDRIYVSLSL